MGLGEKYGGEIILDVFVFTYPLSPGISLTEENPGYGVVRSVSISQEEQSHPLLEVSTFKNISNSSVIRVWMKANYDITCKIKNDEDMGWKKEVTLKKGEEKILNWTLSHGGDGMRFVILYCKNENSGREQVIYKKVFLDKTRPYFAYRYEIKGSIIHFEATCGDMGSGLKVCEICTEDGCKLVNETFSLS